MEITIPAYREVSNGSGTYIVYRIDISFREWRNIIEKRFSEFYELHEVMKLIQKIIKKPIPELPSQMIFKHLLKKITEQDLEQRRSDLENYMRNLEMSPCSKHSKFFPEFLGLPLRYRDLWALGYQSE